ncbi:MAG TPA: hypothetical protein VEQ61_11085 [Thermoleophilaceae bacterium]|nr:hypothetical protein [Thermoleophilaceae bacterium]
MLAARRVPALLALGAALLALSGCAAPLESPGRTARIELVSSSTVGGYKFDHYRNLDYPCSISGYQTFVIGTKIGSSTTATRPLWVKLHGGGVGFFDGNGVPRPDTLSMSEESAAQLIRRVDSVGLQKLVRDDAAGFRLMAVSMCNRDLYSGGDQPDPNNPNKQPDGRPRTTNGLFATKAAVAFARSKLPTSKAFLHGTSAGSAGVMSVAWSMEREGPKPAGVVADSGVVNTLWERARNEQGGCNSRSEAVLAAIKARVHPELANESNEPDLLVSRGALTVPIMHVWNRGDTNDCGDGPMICPLRDGSTITVGSATCAHEPLRRAIETQGATSRSRNLRVCVSEAGSTGKCNVHVVTTRDMLSTAPAVPADYNATIMDWVRARLAD